MSIEINFFILFEVFWVVELFFNLNKILGGASFIEEIINTFFDFLKNGGNVFEDLLFVSCKADLNLFLKFDFLFDVGN